MGKSTVGELVAERLGLPFVDLDAVADRYYAEVGQDLDAFLRRRGECGYLDALHWWQPARVHAVERLLTDEGDCVFALGAGHTHFEDAAYAQRAERALEPFVNVVLLLRSADVEDTVSVLRERSVRTRGADWIYEGEDILRGWVESRQNQRLATHVVYTEGRSPEDVADVVCGLRP